MIECRDITKVYPTPAGPKTVLKGLQLAVQPGEAVAVFGRSGGGKSTLLNLLGGLDRRFNGHIRVDTCQLDRASDRELAILRRRTLGYVFQDPIFLDHTTAFHNLRLAAGFAGASADTPHVTDCLQRLGLSEVAEQRPPQLSGGQRQRLAIARALLADPPLLLLDEPTGNLDKHTATDLIELLGDLHKEGKTLLIVTHDEALAAACERVLILENGTLKEAG